MLQESVRNRDLDGHTRAQAIKVVHHPSRVSRSGGVAGACRKKRRPHKKAPLEHSAWISSIFGVSASKVSKSSSSERCLPNKFAGFFVECKESVAADLKGS